MALDLVTGASGLVGANLVRALVARGRRVRMLLRPTAKIAQLDDVPDLERVAGDITDPGSLLAACDGVEHVYHCAALVSMWPRLADEMWRVNVGGTDHVIAAARRAGVRRLVHCSSVDAIGVPEGNAPSTEETAWNWDRLGIENPYARTKYESQRRVLAAAVDLDAVVVNPTYMLGAYDARPSSGRMILEVASGKAVGYPAGGNNFVDVEDVADGMIAAATRGVRGESYILGGVDLTYREAFTLIAEVVGARPPRLAIPWPAAWVAGHVGDVVGSLTGREPAISTVTTRMGWVRHYYSPRKAIAALGMRQTPIRTAVERAVRWFRAHGMLRSP